VGRKSKPFIEGLEITAIAAEGKALGKHGDMVVFVPSAVPGDIVDVQVLKKRKSYCEGTVKNYRKLSENRAKPFCAHFGLCGGCKWQILPYQQQLSYKQQQVEDQFRRIGKLEFPKANPIAGCDKTEFYRNKLEFSASNKRWVTEEEAAAEGVISDRDALGFHIPGRFDKIADIEFCHLQASPSNEIRLFVKQYAIDSGMEFYDIRNQSGMLRNLIVRTSSNGQVMVIAIFKGGQMGLIEGMLSALCAKFESLHSVMYVINPKANDTITDLEVKLYKGEPCIYEEMEGLSFKIGPKSFFQTNSGQAYRLYYETRRMAGLTGSETVYDLYTGTGTIALFVAKHAAKVVGIEYVEDAIADAKTNAANNGISNASFFAGDMKDVLTESFIQKNGKPDIIIADPPRAGMHESVIATIISCKPDKIIYVSCNPATQARDIALLAEKYAITEVQPVDMFPHTHHVENIALLELKKHN
jgi:23S rRNA (uracil1939-C5)-methyltransferase